MLTLTKLARAESTQLTLTKLVLTVLTELTQLIPLAIIDLALTNLTPAKLVLTEFTEVTLSSPLKLSSPVSGPLRVATRLHRHQGKWNNTTTGDWTKSEKRKENLL